MIEKRTQYNARNHLWQQKLKEIENRNNKFDMDNV